MKLFNHIFLIILPCLINCSVDFTETENEIVVALANYFRVAFCIYSGVESKSSPTVSLNYTFPARQNVYAAYLNFNEVEKYLKDEDVQMKYGGLTMIIVKMNDATIMALKEISQKMSLSPVKWLMIADKSFDSRNFQGVYVPFDCEFVYANPRASLYIMTEIYRIKESSNMESDHFGYWSEDKGLSAPTSYFYDRRSSLKNHEFTATIGYNPPYSYIEKEEKTGRLYFKGYAYEVWRELEFRLKFTTKFPEKWYNRTPADALYKDNADFAVTPVKLNPTTAKEMDLSQPIYESKILLFGHRPGSELEWNSYLKPFSTNTWYVNLGWMIASSIAFSIVYKLAWTYGTSEREGEFFLFTWQESFATVFRAMCMQGSDITPKSNSCRLLFLSIYLTALVVSSAFSAALFSLLTIPAARSPFTDFDDVLSSRGFRMGIIPNSDIYKELEYIAMRYPKSYHYKLLHKLLDRADRLPNTLRDGLEKICDSRRYTVMWDLPRVLDTMMNMTRTCQNKVMPSGGTLWKEYIGFGFKKGNPYRHLIDLHIVQMKNEGVIKRIWMNHWPDGIPKVSTNWVKVTLSDISPILYLFMIGAGLSVVFLILEKIKAFITKREIKGNSGGKSKYFWENVKTIVPGYFQSKWIVPNDQYMNWINSGGKNDWHDSNTNSSHGDHNSNNHYWDKDYDNDPYNNKTK